MVAYSFRPLFVDAIRNGSKRQTIRAPRLGRSRHARPGEELQLFTGQRTKHCRLIGRATCQSVASIRLGFENEIVSIIGGAPGQVCYSSYRDLDMFARMDGFASWRDLVTFWRATNHAGGAWEGDIIFWHMFVATP